MCFSGVPMAAWCWIRVTATRMQSRPAPYLQIEELQAIELVEDVMRQGRETTAVHMEALELLKSAEGSPLQPAEARIVTQIQLLQIPQLTEGPCLNPRDVVGEQPQNLMQENTFDFRCNRA